MLRKVVVEDYAALSNLAAGIVAGMIWSKPDLVLGLPTGGTPVGMYRALVNSGISMARVRTFNLDEYVGLPREHPESYYSFMKRNLYDHVDLDPANAHLPNGNAPDPEEECRRYEEAIREAGGIDLMILGIGHNGHIGFNEPETPWDSRTRRVSLTETTRRANARFFSSLDEVPREALTMGIGTIMESRRIILLASGKDKASIVDRALNGEPSILVPATVLQQHPDVMVIIDRAAAGLDR